MAYAANKKPGELTALTSLATDDVFVVGDTSDASEVAKYITKANLITDLGTSFAAALGANDNYVTDAEKIVIGNTSNTNSGDQTNITGNAATVTTNANLTGHVTSVGNAAILGSFTKAQLTTAVSDGDPLYVGDVTTNATHTGDATGSGALTVVALNGTTLSGLATGVLKNTTTTGVPFISKVALTEPATAATLTITNNKTLSVSNSLTLAGTDSTTMTFPGTSKTIAANDGSNMTLASQATGDLITASSATAFGRLADVATGQVLVSGGAGVAPSYSATPLVTSIDIGATDTTISKSAAGVIAVEGVVIPSISSTNTLTNKRVTRRVTTTNAPGATPTTNTDNVDVMNFTGLAVAITSMTTNLSGTPVDGDLLMFRFTDDGTARAITWGASFAATTVALPTTTVISTMLRVGFQYSGSTWKCIASC